MPDELNLLPKLSTRQDVFDYLDGHSVKTADGLSERHLTGGLVKAFMLETVPGSMSVPPLEIVFALNGMRIDWLDEDLGLLSSPSVGEAPFGVLERMAARHPVIYTMLKSDAATRLLNPLTKENPWLDRVWLSSPIFEQLWKRVESTSNPRRYTRLKFDHEAFFEVSVDDPDLESEPGADADETSGQGRENRRVSSFTMVDRISTISQKLPGLQQAYRPLQSLVQLRIPGSGRGGHDFYFDGRVTNRSDSFYDHRSNVKAVVELYRRTTAASENVLWLESDSDHVAFRGSALTVRFSERLSDETFERWLDSTFARQGRFRLSGRVFRTGKSRAQIAAIDRHLWQTIQMEVTASGMTALIPVGTCGNTVHRLVTNIQRYLDPAVDVWLGETSYDDLVGESAGAAA